IEKHDDDVRPDDEEDERQHPRTELPREQRGEPSQERDERCRGCRASAEKAMTRGGEFPILYGSKEEGLVPAPDLFSGSFATCHVAGDFDGDGLCDLAAILREPDENGAWNQSLGVLLGRPDRPTGPGDGFVDFSL
ncbi:MAG: hypothetical protein MUD10_04465, partial [Candidatus Pacebacteria bacterium]|nr:hypothetical protein [Candidatus Paceibacterota bacterium]